MVRTITDEGGNEFTIEAVGSGWEQKAIAALAEIESDLVILEGAPTNPQVLAATINLVQRQRKIVKAIWKVAQELGLD